LASDTRSDLATALGRREPERDLNWLGDSSGSAPVQTTGLRERDSLPGGRKRPGSDPLSPERTSYPRSSTAARTASSSCTAERVPTCSRRSGFIFARQPGESTDTTRGRKTARRRLGEFQHRERRRCSPATTRPSSNLGGPNAGLPSLHIPASSNGLSCFYGRSVYTAIEFSLLSWGQARRGGTGPYFAYESQESSFWKTARNPRRSSRGRNPTGSAPGHVRACRTGGA